MFLDHITVHLIETTADAGVPYAPTPWAATVAYVVKQRRLNREQWLLFLKRLGRNWKAVRK